MWAHLVPIAIGMNQGPPDYFKKIKWTHLVPIAIGMHQGAIPQLIL